MWKTANKVYSSTATITSWASNPAIACSLEKQVNSLFGMQQKKTT